jgi:SAM-dependent methyltransferase
MKLPEGSSSHYLDPAAYEHLYRRRRDDVRYYVELAQRVGGPVLELACGAGRISLPIARAGIDLVGLDASTRMLAYAEERKSQLPKRVQERLRFTLGDIRTFRLGKRFPLIVCAFNSMQHLYGRFDMERFLARVRAHLAPGGLFAFDVLMPEPEFHVMKPGKRWARSPFTHPVSKVRYEYTEAYAHDPIAQVLHIDIRLAHPTDPERNVEMLVSHRQFYPQELEALLHWGGLSVVERYGDFDKSVLGPESISQVMVCRVDRSRPAPRPRPPLRAAARRRLRPARRRGGSRRRSCRR